MNPWLILAALTVAVAVAGIARAVRPAPDVRRTEPSLLQPMEALDQFEARCVAEQRDTLHVRFGAGGVQCLDCRTEAASGGAS